jgi:hypothetical protein
MDFLDSGDYDDFIEVIEVARPSGMGSSAA